jgi:beta-ribofuranosylaminobenzene 5'-phosphate synthase
VASRFCNLPVRIQISGQMPSHYGFGSATAIRLATLEAIAAVAGKSVDRADIVRASARGGTSGIGVTTYFDGGLVFDVGVKASQLASLPSSSVEGARASPLIITRFDMSKWKIGICIPLDIKPQTEKQEIAFFKRSCPIPAAATNEILYHVVYGAIASAREHDFDGFCAAINAIQRCNWKGLERKLYGEQLYSLEKTIYALGARAVGMSSLGPGLFFLAENIGTIISRLKRELPQHLWFISFCHNSGRKLQHR